MPVIARRKVKARKDHKCWACDSWLRTGFDERDIDPKHHAALQAAASDGWMVKTGQEYWRVTWTYDGRIYAGAQRIDMTEVVGAVVDDCADE